MTTPRSRHSDATRRAIPPQPADPDQFRLEARAAWTACRSLRPSRRVALRAAIERRMAHVFP